MATVSIIPISNKGQPVIKPTRSMTHPLHPPKKPRTKKGEPLDPDELTRRLTSHLLEQKAKQERRRAARASREAAAAALNPNNAAYHHVPQVAASAFARTTTPDAMRQVHKLAQPAVRLLEGGGGEEEANAWTALQRQQALDRTVVEREKARNRNQWQWGDDMEEAAGVDADRDVFRKPRRTFAELAHLARGGGERPLSCTGDGYGCLEEPEREGVVGGKGKGRSRLVFEGRNDWEQVDEERDGKRTMMERAGLKKRESMWVIKGRKEKEKEKTGKRDKDEAVAGIENLDSPPQPENKSRKNSFLAKFAIKRQPS